MLQNVIPEKLFNDEAFERLIKELLNKDINGYEFMAESTNVTIYRRPQGVCYIFACNFLVNKTFSAFSF